ncbi:SRPBCC domain-containing protein [Plantactinospora sp. S1510]|uniref:SRPBCC domain-containing protein n=1 Tax=Plantactinospora alkalitolerans TaxID=2789879 RepID=A0ABS0H0R0_9ACTN|nr:SRPBCC family protein [Plantactinospora alkalitolerans]MBF9131924.1 SRPBCC domain-containing protein [Plantactinospora alkalitolerans]
MTNESLDSVDGRQRLRIERRLAHPPEKVWPAVTEPEHLSRWFPAEVRLEPRPGGQITFSFGPDGAETTGSISAYDPPRLFAFDWDGDLFRIELRADGPGCLLVFSHTFDDRPAAASYASGWRNCLDELDRLVDGRPAGVPERPSGRLHESYVEAFGLADGVAEATPDGWQVRFERQLTQPVEAVWAALTDAAHHPAATIGATPPPGFTTAEFPAGVITELDAPSLLEYAWQPSGQPAGRIRWELSAGTGHGARLRLVQTGPTGTAQAQAKALTAWRDRIEPLARRLAEEADRNAD